MNDNSILKELRETRERLLHPFGGDLTVYLRDLQRRQKELPILYCRGAPRRGLNAIVHSYPVALELTLAPTPHILRTSQGPLTGGTAGHVTDWG